MRLLFLMPIFELARGGAENYGYRLCKALVERGHDVHVVTDRGSAVSGIKVYEGTVHRERFKRQVHPDLTIAWGFIEGADLCRLGGGAHEYFLKYSSYAYPPFIRWYKRLKNHSPRNRALIGKQRKMLLDSGILFSPNSQFAARQVIAAGADPKAVSVLFNGVDTELFRPAEGNRRDLNMRKEWGLEPSDVAVLFVAHNLLLKNFSLLRRVFHGISEECPGMKLLVVGKRRPNRMPPNSTYLGEMADMVRCYQAADCLAHPTFFDSCANVVLEAMSCGLSVVTSNVCGANEMIEHGTTGFVLPVTGDRREVVSSWANQLKAIGTDAPLRIHTGSNARSAMLNIDFVHYVTRFESLMDEAVRRRPLRQSPQGD